MGKKWRPGEKQVGIGWEREKERARYCGIQPSPKELVEIEELINFNMVEPPGIRSPEGRVWKDKYETLFAVELKKRGLELIELSTSKWGIFYWVRRQGEKKCWLAHSMGPFREREVICPLKEEKGGN
ncbi:hypothetical protein ES703_73012 [subsurface metagenome]